jgi:hypothetical protein
MLGEAVFERASRHGDALVFRPILGLRLLFGTGITLIFLTVAELGIKSSNLLGAVLVLAIAVGLFIAWPGTILVDRTLANRFWAKGTLLR